MTGAKERPREGKVAVGRPTPGGGWRLGARHDPWAQAVLMSPQWEETKAGGGHS